MADDLKKTMFTYFEVDPYSRFERHDLDTPHSNGYLMR